MLWLNPDVARGVLSFLAKTQATTTDDARDAKPGKILHEMRGGEMAALGEVPFGRYYGSCDVTPLFVMLADAYSPRTGDLLFIDQIWPNIAARARMDAGERRSRRRRLHRVRAPVRYRSRPAGVEGLSRLCLSCGRVAAEPPIALCEVQGYAYAAWKGAAELALLRGDQSIGRRVDVARRAAAGAVRARLLVR